MSFKSWKVAVSSGFLFSFFLFFSEKEYFISFRFFCVVVSSWIYRRTLMKIEKKERYRLRKIKIICYDIFNNR